MRKQEEIAQRSGPVVLVVLVLVVVVVVLVLVVLVLVVIVIVVLRVLSETLETLKHQSLLKGYVASKNGVGITKKEEDE